MKVYPNPTTDNLTIEVAVDENTAAQIYSYSGSLVPSIQLKEESTSIDISEFNTGLYIIKIETGDEVLIKGIMKK